VHKFEWLGSNLNRWVLVAVALGLVVIALAPGLIGSERSEESSLTPMPPSAAVPAAVPPARVSSEDAESLQWTPPSYTPPASAPNVDPEASPVSVSVAEADALDCIIEPYEVAAVGSALSAVVAEVFAERSERVSAGQVLAQLDSTVEVAALEVAGARSRMNGNVRARHASAELGRQRAGRAGKLYGEKVVSEDLEQEARAEAELAEAELAHAQELSMLSRLERVQAETLVERRRIRSPIDGVIVERHKAPGEVVNEEALFTVAQLDPLRIHVILPGATYGSVVTGMKAEVWPELPSAGVQVAQVEIVDRVVDAGSGTFGVQLRLPNSDYSLPSGLRCRVRFLRDTPTD
jgi:RND family efflux transporter MFP subunit